MPLPESREETATAANPVKASTINAIQDAIIAGYYRAPAWRPLPTGHFRNGGASGWNTSTAGDTRWIPYLTALNDEIQIPIQLMPGERLLRAIVYQTGAVGTTVRWYLKKNGLSGGFYIDTNVAAAIDRTNDLTLVDWSGLTAELPANPAGGTEFWTYNIVGKVTVSGGLNTAFHGAWIYTDYPIPP